MGGSAVDLIAKPTDAPKKDQRGDADVSTSRSMQRRTHDRDVNVKRASVDA